MNFIPLSKLAKELFRQYVTQGFKVYKHTEHGVLFVDVDCDIKSERSYLDTMVFAFHLDDSEIKEIIR